MKTKQELEEEMTELYGANKALSDAMEQIHKLQMDTTKKLFALNQMLKDMKEKNT
jgi:hypothetical protein